MSRILQGAKEALAIAKGDAIGERITRGKAERGMPWRVATAEALPGYRIKVRFQDGLEGVVDMAGLIWSPKAGVFADLQDAERFKSLYMELGVVTWPDGQDLAPDAMHAAIKQHGQWVLS